MSLVIAENLKAVYPMAKLKVTKFVHSFTSPSKKSLVPSEPPKISSEDFTKIKAFLENAEKQLNLEPGNIDLRQYCAHLRTLLATRYGVSL